MDLNAYIYGDVMTMTRILSQVAMIFDGNSFVVAAKAAALMGIIVAMWTGIARGGQLSASIFFWPLLITVLVITPRVNLVIEDRAGGLARVDDLPIGFAAPVSIITTLGAGVSNMLTENLGLDATSITMDNGHLVALRAPMVYEQVITDPEVQGEAAQFANGLSPSKDTIKYVQTCLAWSNKSAAPTEKMHQLQNASLSSLRVDDGPMTVAASNGRSYECSELYDLLIEGFESSAFQASLNSAVNKFFGKYQNDTTTGMRYQSALEAIWTDTGRFYALAAFSNALRLAPNDLTQAAGGGSHEAALQDALAQKREKNYGLAAMVFETISYTIGFMEAWSFSIIPLVLLLLMLGAVGAKISVKYFWMLVWIQLWYPTILIVMGYLDASLDSMSVSALSSVANYNAFMTELARLQDVGYMNFSMATALSMFLVFGSQSVLAGSMQRDISGSDHYDQKKNAPDTLSRQPHYAFQSGFTHSAAGGYQGVDAKKAFAGMTFTFDAARADGVSYAQMESIAAGSSFGTSVTSTEGRGSSSSQSSAAATAVAERFSVGRDSASSLSFRTGITAGRDAGMGGASSDAYGSSNQVSIAGIGSGSISGPSFGSKGASGAGSGSSFGPLRTQGGVTGQASSTASHKEGIEQTSNATFHMGTETGGGTSNSATARSGEEKSDTSSKTSSKTDEYRTSDQYAEQGTIGAQVNRTSQESENRTSAETVSRHAAQVFDAISVANGVARDDATFKMLNDLVNLSPEIRSGVDDFLSRNADKLDMTFAGPDKERASFALAGLYVAQGMYSANLFPNDPNSKERMEALNVLSDEIMFRTGFGSKQEGGEQVSVEQLRSMEPVDPNQVQGAAASKILGYKLDEETAISAADRTPLGLDGDANFDRYLNELGMDLEKLTGGQLNGLFSAYRERLDANRAKMDSDSESFMQIYRDVGLAGAISNSIWWSDSMTLRRNAIADAYEDATDVKVASAGEADDRRNAELMLQERMLTFKEGGIATEGNDLARYMALTQLELGAKESGNGIDSMTFSDMRAELRQKDEVLGDPETAKRIEAFALTGASSEAMHDAYVNAQNEYGLSSMMLSAERRSGAIIRDDGEGVEWSSNPVPTARGEMNGGGTTLPKGSAEDLALTFIGSLEGPRGYDDYERKSTAPPPRDLTMMTIGEVKAWQAERIRGVDTRAAGRYQITEQAWGKAMAGTGLSDDDLFSAANQDRMGIALLEHRGLSQFRADGDVSAFGNRISQEWAILPKMTGGNPNASYYEGEQGNASGTNTQAVTTVLNKVFNAQSISDVRLASAD